MISWSGTQLIFYITKNILILVSILKDLNQRIGWTGVCVCLHLLIMDTPFTYVICKGKCLADDVITINEEIIWNTPLQGPTFNDDSNTVLILLKTLCNGTKSTLGSRESNVEFRQYRHYSITMMGILIQKKRIQAARHNNKNIFYMVDTSFYFEVYCMAIT